MELLILLIPLLFFALGACKAETGIENTCDDLLRVGGAGQTFWVGYISELEEKFDLSQATSISTMNFLAYGGLRRFDGQKYAHSFGSQLQVAAGGNKSFLHTFVAKLFSNSTEDDKVLQDLAVGTDIFVVAQNNNQEIFILGPGNGLSATEGAQNTGTTADSDTTETLTLTGAEKVKPLRFLSGGSYSNSIAALENWEI